MPDETTPPATAAEAATTNEGGVTPPATATPSGQQEQVQPNSARERVEQLRQTLRGATIGEREDRDPLFTSAERDPLFDEAPDNDPLAGATVDSTEGDGATPPDADADTGDTTSETEEEAAGETEEEQSTEETTEADEQEQETGEKASNDPKRIRLRRDRMSDRDWAVIKLANEESISIAEATQRLFGDAPAAAEKPKAESKTTEEPATPAPGTAELEQQITTLKADRRKAADALDMAKMVELDEALEAARDQLAEARSREQRTQSEHQSVEAESKQRVVTMWPDAVKEGSPLHTELQKEVERVSARNPAFFADPEWPEALTAKVAARLGIAPQAAKAPAVQKPTPAPAKKPAPAVPKKPARPVTPAPGGITAPAQTTEAQVQKQIADARKRNNPAALREILRQSTPAAA